MVSSPRNAIGEKCQLLARAAGHLHFVNLYRVRKARPDQHLAPARMPGENRGTSKFRVTIGAFRNRDRDGRNALDDEIISRGQSSWRS